MTLDEAIKHAEEVAKEQEELYRLCPASESMFHCDGTKDCKTLKNGKNKGCRKCAEEHQQLAEWLKDYQQILKERHFDDAKKHFDAIYKLAQTTGMTYSFVEACIEEAETALLKASPQPCDDCISRQEVLALAKKECDTAIIPYRKFVKDVNALPPVTPQPKIGRWIIKDGKEQGYDIAGTKTWYIQIMCDKCGFIKTAIEGHTGQYKFCPNCGQPKMQEVQNENF